MPHSHHSHSGTYCNHATHSLSCILSHAHSQNFTTYALTEHIPRPDTQLYPGEADSGWDSEHQWRIFDAYMGEACALRGKYAVKREREEKAGKQGMKILVGFETEWIDSGSEGIVRGILQKYDGKIDFFVGSVHHVGGIGIDFTKEMFAEARDKCGGEVELFCRYFDAQCEMLTALKPLVVGHFDLVRLYAEGLDGAGGWAGVGEGEVWKRIVRNLEVVRGYGGVLEVNTSGLRKGLGEPYPGMEIVREFDGMGGLFVFSDDSHGVGHVGTNYGKALDFVKKAGLKRIAYLDTEEGKVGAVVKTMSIDEFEKHPYWQT